MIEILCTDARSTISLERPVDGLARLHIGTGHGVEAILGAIGHELSPEEAAACRRLWADDHAPRVFRHTPEGTLFTLAD